MFPNSSGPFFSLFLFMQREILCHIYPSKVPTLIHLARGKNLRWMPPRCLPDQMLPDGRYLPDASRRSQMLPDAFRCVPDASRCLQRCRCLPDASKMPPDASMMPPGCLHMTPRCFPQDPLSLAQLTAQVCKQALFGV